jgi:hypothetical protein
LETTVKGNVTTKTAVIITYNTNDKDWGTAKYGQVINTIRGTKVLTQQADGTLTTNHVKYNPSQLMRDFIYGAKDYHCGGCLSAPSVMEKYLEFIKESNGPPGQFYGNPTLSCSD